MKGIVSVGEEHKSRDTMGEGKHTSSILSTASQIRCKDE